MLIKPSNITLKKIKNYNSEVVKSGKYGAITRCALNLKVSRQCVEQIIKKYSHHINKINEIEYITCEICKCDVPKDFQIKNVCRDCSEQQLRRCSQCNYTYRPDDIHKSISKKLCKFCTTKNHYKWQQENKDYLKEYLKQRKNWSN